MDNQVIYFILFALVCTEGTWSINLDLDTLKKAGVESRIRGGEETTIEKRPYMAFLIARYIYDSTGQRCSGAIISKHHIVTSAFCVYLAISIDVRVGSTDSTTGGQRYSTKVFMEHPMFNRGESDYDVGVVVIKEGMVLDGSTVHPIEVVDPFDEPQLGDKVTISGWGRVDPGSSDAYNANLKEADFIIIENEECEGPEDSSPIITDRHICIIDDGSYENSACEGDQGDPVVDENGTLIGVVAMFPECEPPIPLTVVSFSDPQIRSFIMTLSTE